MCQSDDKAEPKITHTSNQHKKRRKQIKSNQTMIIEKSDAKPNQDTNQKVNTLFTLYSTKNKAKSNKCTQYSIQCVSREPVKTRPSRMKATHTLTRVVVVQRGNVVVSVRDNFWSHVSPFFQLSWNSHTPLFKHGRHHSDLVGFDMHVEILSV